eukprot:GHVU01166606.1.p1 GENE.GHVU01166606.1~~GHVU01166606.1.p1  ORF type:complete len:195 (+),score=30.81 GHVU01166606.1:497-1081(+)
MRDEANDVASALLHFATMRFVDCKTAPRQNVGYQFFDEDTKAARQLIETAGKCFDLRQLCVEPTVNEESKEALEEVVAAAGAGGVQLPHISEMLRQYEALRLRLHQAYTTRYHRQWSRCDGTGAIIGRQSGTVIMKSLLTDRSLFAGLGDILFVFEMCALKIGNESVLEGMNSVVSKHADSVRGASADTYEAEA